jgi:hypothetical protein
VSPGRFCKGGREKKRKGERLMNLAEIHLNLKSSKFWSNGGGEWFRSDFKWIARHPLSFKIFGQAEIGFWVSSYFPIWGAKIKFK